MRCFTSRASSLTPANHRDLLNLSIVRRDLPLVVTQICNALYAFYMHCKFI